MEDTKQKIRFIICPACNGSGKGGHGFACPNCAGMGIGAFLGGIFYYWGPNLSLTLIKVTHLKKKISQLINFISLFICLVGFLSLVWWFGQNSGENLSNMLFWRVKHLLLLIFWISIIFDMFVFYRLSEEELKRQKIRKISYEDKRKAAALPDNWQELKKTKKKVDVSSGFGQTGMAAIEEAYSLARKLKHKETFVMHLFFSLFKDKSVLAFFSRLNIDTVKLVKKIKDRVAGINEEGKAEISLEVKKVLIEAYLNALEAGKKEVRILDLILPCQSHDKVLAEVLYDFEIDKSKIINCLAWFLINERMVREYRVYRKMARFKPSSTMDRAYTAVATPVLNHFAYDLTIAAKWGRLDFIVARDKEIASIFQHLESGHMGVILTGEKGTGKNSIIEGIAQLMVEEDVPKILKDKRLIKLDVARLVSGASPAQAQERLVVIIDEVTRAGNIILYIENIENIIGITSGEEQSLDLAEVLVGALERKNIICFATATSQNYVKYIEESPIGSAMANVKIKEPIGDQAIQIIEAKVGPLEARYKVYFSYDAMETVISFSGRFMHDKYLPAKAVELLELVAVKVSQNKGEWGVVDKEEIAKAVSEITNIPVAKISAEESDILINLEAKIHERMIDQEEAVSAVAASLRRARAELREAKRPISSFLFLGPTGVGKTELAKTVADIYFGNEKNMIRVDMSEYQHEDSIEKMIGNPNGGRGYLTEAARKNPFSLILLDEFEKAHPDILNLFLQVMEDGRLTDGSGRTVDFTNSVIIATSNAEAVFIQDQVRAGTPIEKIKEVLMNERISKIMKPELVNRFDGVIVFKPLSEGDVLNIAKIMLAKIGKMLEVKGIGFRVEEEGVKILAKMGYDPKFGARPLRRLLQDKIENEIANKILGGGLDRRDIVVIDSQANIQIERAEKL